MIIGRRIDFDWFVACTHADFLRTREHPCMLGIVIVPRNAIIIEKCEEFVPISDKAFLAFQTAARLKDILHETSL